jgi:transcription elongation factor GreA
MSSRPQAIYLTAEGADKLRQELEVLVTVKRPALAERLHQAIQQGDLSENADYTSAKEEQGFLEGRIQQIEETLRRAKMIAADPSSSCVVLGSRVTVIEEGVDEQEVFRVVGPTEADPLNGQVSNESPLGRALLGRRVGDTALVRAPRGDSTFRITAIE